MPNNSGEQHGLNLLSFDGGGITGLSSLLILKEIMTKVQEQDGRDIVPKPCELFDMIAGTGTGAISAVMLGRLRMDIDEAIRAYTRLMNPVFSEPKHTFKGDSGAFKASVLKRELRRIIGSAVGDQDEKMVEEEQADGGVRCKVVVYAMSAYNLASAPPIAFRSYPTITTPTRCTIWEALRATTAHPHIFKSIQVDVEGTGLRDMFKQGGLGCTNPTPRLLEEAKRVYPGRGVASITSIGTGHPGTIQITNRRSSASWGGGGSTMVKVMQAAHEMAQGSERVAEEMARRYSQDGPLYYRLNTQLGTQEIDASKWERLDEITTHTRVYLDQAQVGAKIDKMVEASTQPLKLLISELPCDILVLIFKLVLCLNPCRAALRKKPRFGSHNGRPSFQRDPVILSQVCSHWRRTAIDTATLWTHIDIQPCLGGDDVAKFKAAARWDVYAQRSRSCLLDIHVADQCYPPYTYNFNRPQIDGQFYGLIQRIAPRTQHLAVWCLFSFERTGFLRQTMSSFLGLCVPGVLKALSLFISPLHGSDDVGFRFTNEPSPLALDLPESKLESLLHSILVLNLSGYYPRSGSKAYCGLAELRLHNSKSSFLSIDEMILVDIFKSNPRLRVLKFDMEVTNMLPDDAPVTPIHVDDLQVVNMGVATKDSLGNILRWLIPGSKPLSLSIYTPYKSSKLEPGFTTRQETQKFIARSNVTKLGLRWVETCAPLGNMLIMATKVKVLAVSSVPSDVHLLSKPPRSLDALYVIPSFYATPPNQKNLQRFARYYDAGQLTVWTEDLKFDANGDFGTKVTIGDVHAWPSVSKVITEEPNPVAEWY